MSAKLPQKSYPAGHCASDFKCFGPPAVEDGIFEGTMICDLGCFKQDGTDSNKFYHASVVQSTKDISWHAYFEWGRTGQSNPSFQFIPCGSRAEAEAAYCKQLHSKNDKRGEWVMLAGKKRLQAKKGKDCYLVRPQATRSTGLPDAKTITLKEDVAQAQAKTGVEPTKKKKTVKKSISVDPQTIALMRDMNMATISYTRNAMADAALPTINAIEEARDIVTAARQRLVKVGDEVDDQVKDNELKQLTYQLYSRIPKKKALRADPSEWILSKDNILMWDQDLDAFESALAAEDLGEEVEHDPYGGALFRLEWLGSDNEIGKWVREVVPNATRNRHSYLGAMKIYNVWKVDRFEQTPIFQQTVEEIAAKRFRNEERPLHQPQNRPDVDSKMMLKYVKSNTCMLYHGTRSTNLTGILRTGLRLPKQLVGVHITGASLGPGTYYADDWKKSAGYCSLKNSCWAGGKGGVNNRHAFMFVTDVVLGKMHLSAGTYPYINPPGDNHSVAALGGRTSFANNEFVIYNTKQYEFKYLLEFSA